MQELGWAGTIALLDKPTKDGKILHSHVHNSWIDLPITVWNDGVAAGVITNISLLETHIIASGTASQGALLGRLMTGNPVHVSPNIKFTAGKTLITGITVVSTPVWAGVHIRKHK